VTAKKALECMPVVVVVVGLGWKTVLVVVNK
jgi:hypothetical protein